MQEHLVPSAVPSTTTGNLADLPFRNAARRPDHVVAARAVDGSWQDVTAARFADDVSALAKGLIASGIQPGERVGLMSKTRYEWTVADFAIWAAGGVVVPIYETSSAEQVRWILADSEAAAVIVETAHHEAVVAEVRPELAGLRSVWQIDGGAVADLSTQGASVSSDALDARRAVSDRATVATIIYTSGTTGRPKGCELTHGNLRDLAENTTARLAGIVAAPNASTLLFLPLAHVFARFIEILCIESGAKLAHSSDLKNLLGDLAGYQPTFVLAVPPGARGRSSPRPPPRRSPTARPSTRARSAWSYGSSTSSSTVSSSARSVPPWVARSSGPSPVERPLGPAWVTTSVVSG